MARSAISIHATNPFEAWHRPSNSDSPEVPKMTTQIEVPAPGQRTVVETSAGLAPQAALAPPATQSEPATHNYRAVQVIWMVTSLVTIVVGIRFVLKLLGASTQSGFVSFTYSLT